MPVQFLPSSVVHSAGGFRHFHDGLRDAFESQSELGNRRPGAGVALGQARQELSLRISVDR